MSLVDHYSSCELILTTPGLHRCEDTCAKIIPRLSSRSGLCSPPGPLYSIQFLSHHTISIMHVEMPLFIKCLHTRRSPRRIYLAVVGWWRRPSIPIVISISVSRQGIVCISLRVVRKCVACLVQLFEFFRLHIATIMPIGMQGQRKLSVRVLDVLLRCRPAHDMSTCMRNVGSGTMMER